MSATSLDPPPPLPSLEPMTLSLAMAAALHAAVILGIGFSAIREASRVPPTLEVVLVQSRGGEEPDQASYLAQVSQEGGGNTERRERPTAPFLGTERLETDGVAPQPVEAAAPRPRPRTEDAVLVQLFAEHSVPERRRSRAPAEHQLRISEVDVDANLEIARLSAELDEMLNRYAERPRKEFISARTKEASAAAYMFKWVERVERIGNLNYPDVARAKRLSGRLLLTVGIERDGSLASVELRHGSGVDALDAAAEAIVRLAAPFAPLRGELGQRTDTLYITRTWEFDSGELHSDR